MVYLNFLKTLSFLVLILGVKESFSAFYPRVYKDLIIPRGIFSAHLGVDWLWCIEACMKKEACLSYNYDVAGATNHTCELSKCAAIFIGECSEKTLRYSRGFVYQQLKEIQRDWDPCDDVVSPPSTPTPGPSYYKDCADAMRLGIDNDGLYSIDPDGRGMFSAQCDQSTDGGGWVVIQRRFDGTQSFNLGWKEYFEGFGNLGGEFWLGLDRINRLTSMGNSMLRIGLQNTKGDVAYALYKNFSITKKETKFRLNLTFARGTAGDSLERHSGHPFSTKDNDNDLCDNCSCAMRFKSAWWYDGKGQSCLYSDLNGEYYRGITWSTWMYEIKNTVMMIRPDNI